MRAKFINEKFSEEGDPIKDMGIGIVDHIKKGIVQLQISPGVGSINLIGNKYLTINFYGNGPNGGGPVIQHLVKKYLGEDFFKSMDVSFSTRFFSTKFKGTIKSEYVDVFKEAFNNIF